MFKPKNLLLTWADVNLFDNENIIAGGCVHIMIGDKFMHSIKLSSTLFALIAALLYAINMPFSKLLLNKIEPVFMASFLYLGAGIGIGIIYFFYGKNKEQKEKSLAKADIPFALGMIILDILAPIFLMIGLQTANSANASLLNNFEIVVTTVIALVVFKEIVSKRLWLAILFITLSSILLTVDDLSGLEFSYGSIFVVLACICWGFENNCTRMLASKNTYEIVMLKGVFSGLGSFIIALIIGEHLPNMKYILFTLMLGFIAFGLSIFLYIKAQDVLGASKTSAYYATSPFIGAFISFVFFKSSITSMFILACIIMIIGIIMVIQDTFTANHIHEHTHRVYANKKLIKIYTHSHAHNHYDKNCMDTLTDSTHKHFHGITISRCPPPL